MNEVDNDSWLGRWRWALLWLGLIVGLLIAMLRVVRPVDEALPSGAIAMVNGRIISEEIYRRALQAMASDRKGGGLAVGDKERVLERLIDEALLLDHAVGLELYEHDPQLRSGLVSAMMAHAAQGAPQRMDEAELKAHYERESFRFVAPLRVRVRHAFARKGPEAVQRIEQALSQGRWSIDPAPLALGEGWLAPATLEQKLGPRLAKEVLQLEIGSRTPILESTDGVHVLELVERKGGETLPFKEVRELVLQSYRRTRSENAVRRFLDAQRKQASIRIGELP